MSTDLFIQLLPVVSLYLGPILAVSVCVLGTVLGLLCTATENGVSHLVAGHSLLGPFYVVV